MSRSMLNCSTMRAVPAELVEVISSTPAMVPRCRSKGVVTEVDMVSGLAPAIDAETNTTGISTLGSGATGSRK